MFMKTQHGLDWIFQRGTIRRGTVAILRAKPECQSQRHRRSRAGGHPAPAASRGRRRGSRGGGRCGAALAQPAQQHRQIEEQMQADQQQGRVPEQEMPVKHRQLLIGHPEDAESGRAKQVDHEQQAAVHIDRYTRRRAPAPGQYQQQAIQDKRQQHPQDFRTHGTF